MIVSVIATPNFQREAKKLIKKYRSLKSELEQLISDLEADPRMGTLITEKVYKIRLAVKSKGTGKSGGMRIITYVEAELVETENATDVYLLSIYDKSNFSTISQAHLKDLIDDIQSEIGAQDSPEETADDLEN